MPRRHAARHAAVLLLAAALDAGIPLPAAPPPKPPAPEDPGAAVLKSFVGVWDATMQIASPDDSPPLILNGIEVNVMGEGGAWVTSDFRSLMGDRPFQGHAILSLHPGSGRFRRVWADVTSPAFWLSEGTWDAGTRTLTLWVETVNSGGRPVRWHEETVFKDDNTRTFTMYVPGTGVTEAAAITIVYRRRRESPPPPQPLPADRPPGPEHAVILRDVGTWSAQLDNRRGGGPPSSKGRETNLSCCGGNFLITDYVGGSRKEPFAGHGILGYDPDRKKYVSAWVDTADKALEVYEGEYDAAADTLTFRFDAPDGRGGSTPTREVLEWKGSDQRTLTFWVPRADGREEAGMTIKYRRTREAGPAERR